MHARRLRSASGESGAIAIIVALLAVTLFGFAALVVDIGNADSVHEQGQSAVDAAALAGVRTLASGGTDEDVENTVKKYVADNMGITKWAGCSDPKALAVKVDSDTSDTCISTLTSGTPGVTSYQVRVKLPPKHVPSTFAGIFGVSSIAVSPVAQALSGQPLPPECGPCDPALDETTGQPKPESPEPVFPFPSELPNPDPAVAPLAGPLDVNHGNCPTTPGVFNADNVPTGVVTITANFTCDLKPGLYVFDDTTLDVQGNLYSHLAPDNTGVTLVFYGTGTMTVEGGLGIRDTNGQRTPLFASKPDVVWQPGQPIPGVAIVLDQFPPAVAAPRSFSLGDHFDITGSVYALDGQTTWDTAIGDCPAVGSTCWVHDEGANSVIATTTTQFMDSRIPTVGTDHPMAEPPPSAPHLVK